MVAAQPGIWVAPIFYNRLEIAKNVALCEQGNFDATIHITEIMVEHIQQWIVNVQKFPSPVHRENPETVVTSDASKKGGGSVMVGLQEECGVKQKFLYTLTVLN